MYKKYSICNKKGRCIKINYRLGLDIGIASVGWGIVDEKDNIVDAGVRLFPEAGKDVKTSDRRTKRCARRLLRRRGHRNERVRKLLFEHKLIDNVDYDFYTNEITPYEIRVKGIKEKLSDRELAICLLHLVKRRGIHNFEIKSSQKESEEDKGTKNILNRNDKLLADGKYVSEIQFEKLNNPNEITVNNGAVRGINNVFRTDDYKKEAVAILNNQMKHNSKITEDFITKYINILQGRREYYQGPGKYIEAKGNISPYGWKNEVEWMENLFGRCTYFPEEIRMAKNSYTAELFNLLNDLNNLTLKRESPEKLTKEEKEEIIEIAKGKKAGVTLKEIAKIAKVVENDILGYRIDKNGKAIFTGLSTYKEIRECIPELKEDRDKIDEVSKILTIYQTQDKIKEKLGEILDGIEIKNIENLPSYTGSHSLSKKAMNEILDELLNTSKNQMELFTEKNLIPYKMNFKEMKKIPKNYIKEWILSSVVKRSLSQTLNVINEIHDKYGIPQEIVIEMAREKNSDEQRKILQDLQKKNENINKQVNEYIAGKAVNWGKGVFEKIKFWIAQDGICMYSGKKIPIEILLAYPMNYEIDHIIPRSISFDDSQNNKVLVDRDENQNKGNTTPYHYLSTAGRYEEFKQRILKDRNISKTKREYLLFEGDLDKYATKFIARNLVDTRYATRELLIMLKRFYTDNEMNVKIKSVRGSVTAQVRKIWDISKERDICHNHHAIDALVMLQGEKILNTLPYVKEFNKNDKSEGSYDLRTGEIIDDEKYRALFKHEYGERIKNYNKWRYSHYVDKKPNRQLTDETIYSTRLVTEMVTKGKKEVEETNEYVISKLSGIYDKTNKKIKEFFADEKKQKQLLMYHHDPKTFEKFMEVYNAYSKEVNPFFSYYNEHGKYITKYAKKDNGPPVFDIKYRVQKLGSHLDLSHKYNLKTDEKNKTGKVVMLSIPSLRADFYKKGEIYKFVSVTYLMMEDKGKYYELNMGEYEKQKAKKEIDETYEFIFSLYSGDIFEYETNEGVKEKVKFKGINNDEDNRIEVDFIDRNFGNFIENIKKLQEQLKKDPTRDLTESLNLISGEKYSPLKSKNIIASTPVSSKQKRISIGKLINNIRKIYTNNLGVEYDSTEKLISKIKK